MGRLLSSVDMPGLPKLFTGLEARQYIGCGVNKWTRIKREIDCVMVDGVERYTSAALVAYLKRKTRKGAPPEPRANPPPRPAPAKAQPAHRIEQGEPAKTPSAQRQPAGRWTMTTSQVADDLVKAANEALDRIDAAGDGWLIIGEAYQHGRRRAMAEERTNKPVGKSYNATFEAWCERTHFNLDRIDKTIRRDLARIMENRPAFDVWRATLAVNQRQAWNHPLTMWRRFTGTRAKGGSGPTLEQKARPNVVELRTEIEMLKGKLVKAREGQLLIDLDRDDDTDMTRVVLQEPAVLRNPKRFAALFRRWAFRLEEQTRKRQRSDEARPGAP